MFDSLGGATYKVGGDLLTGAENQAVSASMFAISESGLIFTGPAWVREHFVYAPEISPERAVAPFGTLASPTDNLDAFEHGWRMLSMAQQWDVTHLF